MITGVYLFLRRPWTDKYRLCGYMHPNRFAGYRPVDGLMSFRPFAPVTGRIVYKKNWRYSRLHIGGLSICNIEPYAGGWRWSYGVDPHGNVLIIRDVRDGFVLASVAPERGVTAAEICRKLASGSGEDWPQWHAAVGMLLPYGAEYERVYGSAAAFLAFRFHPPVFV